MSKAVIPDAVIAVVADILGSHGSHYTHDKLNTIFMEYGAPGDIPGGNRVYKCSEWLKQANWDETVDAFALLGGVLKEYMDVEISDYHSRKPQWLAERERIHRVLAKHGLSYHLGGQILGAVTGVPSRSLESIIRERDLGALNIEFQRATESVSLDPPAAVTAACNIIESLCKTYIHDEHLEMPSKQTVTLLWKVVQKHLGLDPGTVEDQDISRILGGLASVIDGIGALRTHAGSAHGHGPESYQLDARHARLAIHAAHTLAIFIVETWDASKA